MTKPSMTWRPFPLPALLVSALIAAGPAMAQEEAAEAAVDEAAATPAVDTAAAKQAALDWLALVDEGDYEQSWEQAASAMQDAVTPATWSSSLSSARAPFDPLGERTLIATNPMTDPPGAPPGQYAIFQFRTQAAGERTIVETVAPMLEDGTWKVSGYFIRPE